MTILCDHLRPILLPDPLKRALPHWKKPKAEGTETFQLVRSVTYVLDMYDVAEPPASSSAVRARPADSVRDSSRRDPCADIARPPTPSIRPRRAPAQLTAPREPTAVHLSPSGRVLVLGCAARRAWARGGVRRRKWRVHDLRPPRARPLCRPDLAVRAWRVCFCLRTRRLPRVSCQRTSPRQT